METNYYYIEDPYILTEEERQNLDRKNSLFQKIVEEFPDSIGNEISLRERDERDDLPVSSGTLTYGEVDFISIGEVFESIKQRHGGIPSGGIFYDLGSGTGKGVVAAALLHSFEECRGIEILESLYQVSLQMQEKYMDAFFEAQVANPDLWENTPQISFFLDDIFNFNWTDASFVFANSTCFDIGMMRKIAQVPLRPGTLGISFTKQFNEEEWEVLESVNKDMSWGETTVFIQRKRGIL